MKESLDRPIIVSITAGTVVKTIFVFLLFWLLWVIKDLILVLLTSVVLASAINPAAKFFAKRKVPRVFSVLTVYVLIILLFIGVFSVFLPPLVDDLQTLSHTLPAYIESISDEKLANVPGLDAFITQITGGAEATAIVDKVANTFSGAAAGFLSTASTIFGGLFYFVLIIVFSFYLAVQEDGVRDFLRIITPLKHEPYVLDLWRRAQKKIGLWMQGQLLLAAIVGILTYLGLSILGVPNPMFLALIAAMFELIPIFGPILAAVPAILFALIDGGATLGLLTLGLYVIIQQFESQLIHPLVVKKIVGIPALVAILSLIIGAQIAGFLGLIIAVPVAAAIMEFLYDLEKKKALQSDSGKTATVKD